VSGVHYTDEPYLIFVIDSSQERGDWGEIPELKTAYAAIKDAVVGNEQTKARSAFEAFRRLAVFSPDLIQADATRLVSKVNDLLNSVFKEAGTAGETMHFPDLHDVGLYSEM
jgi:hypothetical protein